jgi:hypothetical protein
MTRFLFPFGIRNTSDSYVLISVVRPLWREDGLSFVSAAGPCQRSLSRVLVLWDLSPYFTVSDLRLPFSSPPTTRRVTVEVFDPTSTRGQADSCYIAVARTTQKRQFYCCVAQTTQKTSHVIAKYCWSVTSLRLRGSVLTEPLPRNGLHSPVVPLLVRVFGCFCGLIVLAWRKYAKVCTCT